MLFVPRPKSLGKDAFLKLADKEEVTGVFQGMPYLYRRHWVGGRSSECPSEGCQICAAGGDDGKSSFRFRINFVTTKDGKWGAKIFEGGGDLYDQLTNLDKKFDLSKTVVDLSRSGMKTNTRYSVIPRTDMPLNDEMKAKIAATPLLPLSSEEAEAQSESA